MKNVITIIFLAFFSLLAQANNSNAPVSSEEVASPEIMLSEVGFDKVLSLVLIDVQEANLNFELSQKHVGVVYTTNLNTSDKEVLEIDLNDFETGTYTLELRSGDHTEVFTLILP